MRLRGLVFERFVTFQRAELNLCDDAGVPLDVVLLVGEAGAGKTSLLRGIEGVLSEAASGDTSFNARAIRRGEPHARCRVVFDDVVDPEANKRVVVTLEKELTIGASKGGVRASPPEAFQRWRRALEGAATPRAAFSVAMIEEADEAPSDDEDAGESLFAWFTSLRGTSAWAGAIDALEQILWPARFDHVDREGDILFATPTGVARSSELGDAFESVLVMALELLRLSTARPNEELVYVIDDIDAHLHPRWQSRLIGDLRRAFPRVQLVASTHSPSIVASVEPHQVFRLERGVGESSVIRAADRLPRGAVTSSIMDVAFGAPELPGPRWIHNPPVAIRRDVIRGLARDLPRGAVVYALPDLTHVNDVRDAFNEHVLPSVDETMGYVFFVDHHPGTAWGHACEYVLRTRDGSLVRQRAIWPPAGLDRYVAIARG